MNNLSSKAFLTFNIRPKNVVNQLVQWRRIAGPEVFNRAMDKVGQEGVRILKLHTPIKTGLLRRSMGILNKQPGKGLDLRSSIKIGSHLDYGRFVDEGTKPSSGRFVPVLGRRIRTGTHPGVRPRNFVQRATTPIEEKARMLLEQYEKAWREKLRV